MMLIRHAQSVWNQHFSATKVDPGIPDPRLTDLGREQAKALAAELGRHAISALIASPYLRALETADIVASTLGLPISVNPLVRERCVFSCDIGNNPEVLREAYPHVDFADLGDCWWGVPPESEAGIADRCRRFRGRHGDLLARDDIAIISHWGFIRAFTGEEVGNATIVHVDAAAPGPAPA